MYFKKVMPPKKTKRKQKKEINKIYIRMSFWMDDPTILLNSNYIFDVLPNEHQSNTQNLNALSRFVIWISLFGYIILKKILF